MSAIELRVDPERKAMDADAFFRTGIFVRAKDGAEWRSADIAELDLLSLLAWVLDARDRAALVVAELLGHRIGEVQRLLAELRGAEVRK